MTNFPSDVLPVLATFFQLASGSFLAWAMVPRLLCKRLGPVVPWDCLHFTNDGCSLLQSLCGHYLFCSCHLSPVTCGHYLCAPVRASWCTPSCHFACSSSGFLVYSLVPFCLLQFVLFGGLPRAILRAPVCAFWRTPSCQFVCSSSRFLVYSLVGVPMEFSEWCPDKQPAAHASIVVELSCFGRLRAVRQSYTRNSKKWRFAGRIVVKFGCFPRAPFCALSCAHCYSQ